MIGLAAGLAGAVFALACSRSSPASGPAEPVTVTIGVPQSRQVDPNHSVANIVGALTNERLTASDAAGRTLPRLLDHWNVSADGLTWTLALRRNVKFHDGSPLTAADVKQRLDEIRNNPAAGDVSSCLADLDDISTSGEFEIVIRFSRRCSFFLDDLALTITRPLPDGARVGTGPFVVESSTADTYNLEAHQSYYLGRPALDRVVVRSYSTLREAWAEMLRGRVDFLWEVGPDSTEFLRDQASVDVRSFIAYSVYTIVPNSARAPFDQPEVRRALNLAIDRGALLHQGLRDQGVAAASPIWPNSWARQAGGQPLPYAPAEAEAILREALGGGARGGTPILTFTCLLPEGFTVYERLALLVQQQLRVIGVEMRLESLPADQFNQRIGGKNFDAVLVPVLGGPHLFVHYRFWHSPSPSPRWNFWGYRSAAVDAALDALRDAQGDEQTRSAAADLDAALRDDPPGIVLVWSETLQAVSRRFTVPENGEGRDALHVLNGWQLRAPGDRLP